jgi:hypothetical protein
MTSARTLCAVALLSTGVFAQSIILPSTLSVAAINPSGTSFTYNGTLTQAATIALTESGASCEQPSGTYCTNGSGVLVVAGTSPVGATTSFTAPVGGFSGTYNFGALIMTISGVGSQQIFAANAGNGLGSTAPPATLSLSATSLSALGFPNFSAVNPTITFTVADTNYADNSGGFSVTQTGLPSTPAPATLALVILGLTAALIALRFTPKFRSR